MRSRVLLLLLLTTCSHEPAGAPPQDPPVGAKPALRPLEHDFGVIPHGASRQHEFAIALDALDERWVPLRVHIDCSCGRADLRLRKPDGSERFVVPDGSLANLPAADERLWLRVVLDTADREPIDLPNTTSQGYVVLQHPEDPTGTARIQWPLRVRFGIDAPVLVRPLATLDFGRVPLSQRAHLVTTLRGDERHPGISFGAATSSDPNVAVEIVPDGEVWRLRATCRPGALGNHRAAIAIENSLPGYRLSLAATWKAVPDLEAVPLPKLSFRAPLGRAQREDEVASQYLVVVDHDTSRPPEFAVARIVAVGGRDLAPCFAVSFAALPAESRQSRMTVRYLGGLTATTRASIVLTKDGERGPFLPVELVVFAAKDP
jgi:hypothetical protein